jgi:hypothetical protein
MSPSLKTPYVVSFISVLRTVDHQHVVGQQHVQHVAHNQEADHPVVYRINKIIH